MGLFEELLAEVRALRAELAATRSKPSHVTVDEYAKTHAIGKSTVRAAIRDGRLTAIKVGRAVRIPADASIGTKAKPKEDAAAKRMARVMELVP